MKAWITCSLIGSLLSASAFAAHQDWPQWRGPHKDGTLSSKESSIAWERLSSASVVWESKVGIGYSSLSIVGDRAYTMGHDGKDHETVYCLDVSTGKERWHFSYPAKLLPAMHVGGPNATPTVFEGAVYTLSKDGQAFCLDAATGETRWSVNVESLLGIKTPTWGYASSPVVYGEHLLFGAGRVVALNRRDGKPAWISENPYHPGYSTPIVFKNGSDSLLTAFDGKGFSLLHADTGEEVARHPFKTQYDMTATDPIVTSDGDRIFISAISQGELLRFDGTTLKSVWSDKAMRNSMNVCALREGYLYGIDGKHKSSRSRFSCVRLRDGEVMWSKESYGYGTHIVVGEALLVMTEEGDLVAVSPSEKAYHELGRKKVLDSICWTPPSVSGNRIFVRNDVGRAICVEVN
tara:strand:+ start:146 stop:1363 length:1218 start_codon:yes stop_codon:yes gene_type:complete